MTTVHCDVDIYWPTLGIFGAAGTDVELPDVTDQTTDTPAPQASKKAVS